jgi:pyruvate-formate lyase
MATAQTTINSMLLERAGEWFAAGFLESPEASPLRRMCRGLARLWAHCPLPPYAGEALYPCGPSTYGDGPAVGFNYSASLTVNGELLERKIAEAHDPETVEALRGLREFVQQYPMVSGYTHSIINFGRVLHEGLDGYRLRLEAHLQTARERDDAQRTDFYEALLELLDGVRVLYDRCCALLAASDHPQAQVVLGALQRVPFGPANTFYEAMVATNWLFYLDGSDDLGRFDQDLWPFYQRDLASGALRREDSVAWVGQVFANVDACAGWNCAIGGKAPDGTQGCNDLTLVCLEAARGRRRPNLALRLSTDTPEQYWDAALECIAGGSGIPALYNEELYSQALHGSHLGLAEADLPWFAFGGCTELMVHGRSNVGSLDAHYNLIRCLESSLYAHLEHCATFEDLLSVFKCDVTREILELTERINDDQARKAQWQPQPIRTLLVDDCLDNGWEFNEGGARYNWSVVSISGLANTYDSLAAVKEVVYDHAEVTPAELLAALRADFQGHEELRRRVTRCPHYGNDDPYVDDIAAEIGEFVFREFLKYAPWRGGKFLASCLMFVTYGFFGLEVGATPDGRLAKTPIGDSAGSVQGRDQNGPTALLRSATRIPHILAPGTLVHNIRFTQRLFNDPEARQQIKSMIRTYFQLGGMQLQINVVDQQVLKDALEHPENYQDLIVRMGGYSEYFNRLSRDLQLSILERTEHE